VIKQQHLLAIQVAVALLVIGAAARVELAAIAAAAAGTVVLIGARGTRTLATLVVTTVAVVAVVTTPSHVANRVRAEHGRGASHRLFPRSRAQIRRHG
jgi:hypothetical protein